MRIHPTAAVLLVILAGLAPFLIASARPAAPGAPVFLATGVIEATDEPLPLSGVFKAPETATWATIRNDSPHLLLLGLDHGMTLARSWTVASGEEVTFSLESPVHLQAPNGTIRVRVLVGR